MFLYFFYLNVEFLCILFASDFNKKHIYKNTMGARTIMMVRHIALFSLCIIGLGINASISKADDGSVIASIEPAAGVDLIFQEDSLHYRSEAANFSSVAPSKPRLTMMQGEGWDLGLGSAPKPYKVKGRLTQDPMAYDPGAEKKIGAVPFLSLRYRFQTK